MTVTAEHVCELPISRQPPCHRCPHEHHFLPCDSCDCHDVPVPGDP